MDGYMCQYLKGQNSFFPRSSRQGPLMTWGCQICNYPAHGQWHHLPCRISGECPHFHVCLCFYMRRRTKSRKILLLFENKNNNNKNQGFSQHYLYDRHKVSVDWPCWHQNRLFFRDDSSRKKAFFFFFQFLDVTMFSLQLLSDHHCCFKISWTN